jgi:hypothetical protein
MIAVNLFRRPDWNKRSPPSRQKGRIITDFAFSPFLCAPCSAPPICFFC